MTKLIPQGVIDAIRVQNDLSVFQYGIDCDLYILNNPNIVDQLDAYAAPTDKTYTKHATQAIINWQPTQAQLRKLGVFAEDTNLPIVAYFKNFLTDNRTFNAKLEIIMGSYIKINTQYVPDRFDVDEFEIVNQFIGPMADKQAFKIYSLAPRREK